MKIFAFMVVAFAAAVAQAQHSYMPRMPLPNNIPITPEIVSLGQMLFYDERLGAPDANGQFRVSCASCHIPAKGYSDGRRVAVGINGLQGQIHTPSLLNLYNRFQFWDGRTDGLPTQSLQPLVNPVEMGNRSEQQVLNRLRRIPGYVNLFNRAFGFRQNLNQAISRERVAEAISAFETTLISSDAPIDRYLAGDTNALSGDAAIGYALVQKANCMACHQYPLFTDLGFHNNGIEFASLNRVASNGLFTVVRNNRNLPQQQKALAVRAFKTPTWRDITLTAPYGHNGNLTLRRILEHYNAGGAKLVNGRAVVDSFIDPRIKPQSWNESQIGCVETFFIEAFVSSSFPTTERPKLP